MGNIKKFDQYVSEGYKDSWQEHNQGEDYYDSEVNYHGTSEDEMDDEMQQVFHDTDMDRGYADRETNYDDSINDDMEDEDLDSTIRRVSDTRPSPGSFADYESEVAYQMTIQGEMPNGDAQGIMEAQPDVVERCFDQGMSAEETADHILNR